MNNESPIRLVKNAERQAPKVRSDSIDQNRWSRTVRSWVREFKQHANEAAPVFDLLIVDPGPNDHPQLN